jgi:hypothetical protein
MRFLRHFGVRGKYRAMRLSNNVLTNDFWDVVVLQGTLVLLDRGRIMGSEDLEETTLVKRIAIVLALWMMSAAGFAQTRSAGNVFLGYSFNRASTGWSNTGNLNGWELSAERKVAPILGFVLDVGTQYGTLKIPAARITNGPGNYDLTTRVESLMFGPRVSVSVGKFRPFATALIGAGHLHEDALDHAYGETSVADAIGGGVDYKIIPMASWRVQGDLLQTRFHGGRQEDMRISTGLVVNF